MTSETVSIGNLVIDEGNVTSITGNGGWDSPEHTVEQGFNYSTYNSREPIRATVEFVVERDLYDELRQIRDQTDPIDGASIGQEVMSKAKLVDLESLNEPSPEQIRGILELEEVREGQTETAEVVIEIGDDTQSSSSEDQPGEDQQTGEADTDDEDDEFDVAESIRDTRESLNDLVHR